jgi:hypothetical protein
MIKFKKKSEEIEVGAIQLNWLNWKKICDFIPESWFIGGCFLDKDGNILDEQTMDIGEGTLGLRIKTLESNEFVAKNSDWIIKNAADEFYVCTDKIFKQTYEEITE